MEELEQKRAHREGWKCLTQPCPWCGVLWPLMIVRCCDCRTLYLYGGTNIMVPEFSLPGEITGAGDAAAVAEGASGPASGPEASASPGPASGPGGEKAKRDRAVVNSLLYGSSSGKASISAGTLACATKSLNSFIKWRALEVKGKQLDPFSGRETSRDGE